MAKTRRSDSCTAASWDSPGYATVFHQDLKGRHDRGLALFSDWDVFDRRIQGVALGIDSQEFHQALKGPNDRSPALSGLGPNLAIGPRALPWAITARPFGASTRRVRFAESAKLEQDIQANLRGLGYGR